MTVRLVARLAAFCAVFALALGPLALAQMAGTNPGAARQSGAQACSGHGQTNFDRCFCDPGWSGPQCASQVAPPNCGDHGKASNLRCVCGAGWIGKACEAPCTHGKARHGRCACDPGWSGAACDVGGARP